jgi:hypothetical protein
VRGTRISLTSSRTASGKSFTQRTEWAITGNISQIAKKEESANYATKRRMLRDRRSFQFVWEELLSLVKRLTNQRLGFVALHRGGTLLGINADMEAAPLLGIADAFLPTIDKG